MEYYIYIQFSFNDNEQFYLSNWGDNPLEAIYQVIHIFKEYETIKTVKIHIPSKKEDIIISRKGLQQ